MLLKDGQMYDYVSLVSIFMFSNCLTIYIVTGQTINRRVEE